MKANLFSHLFSPEAWDETVGIKKYMSEVKFDEKRGAQRTRRIKYARVTVVSQS
jgi:hypothetical protein